MPTRERKKIGRTETQYRYHQLAKFFNKTQVKQQYGQPCLVQPMAIWTCGVEKVQQRNFFHLTGCTQTETNVLQKKVSQHANNLKHTYTLTTLLRIMSSVMVMQSTAHLR